MKNNLHKDKEFKLNVLVVGEKTKEISVVLIENWRYKFTLPIIEENRLGDLVREFQRNENISKSIPRICQNIERNLVGIDLNKNFSEFLTRKLREGKNFDQPKDLKVKKYVDIFPKIQGSNTEMPFVEFDISFKGEKGRLLSPNELYSENQRLRNEIEELIVAKRKFKKQCEEKVEENKRLKSEVEKLKSSVKSLSKKKDTLTKQTKDLQKKKHKSEEKEKEIQKQFRGLKKEYQANMKTMRIEYQTIASRVERSQSEFRETEKDYMQQIRDHKKEMKEMLRLLKEKETKTKEKLREVSSQFGKKVFHGVFVEERFEDEKKTEGQEIDEEEEKRKKSVLATLNKSKKKLESVLNEINNSMKVLKKKN